jgi:arylsulfatase A-like enzyme
VDDPTRERALTLLPTVERILEAHRAGRLFLYLHLREPHFPYDPPPPFRGRFGVPEHLPPEAALDPDWIPSLNRRGGPSPDEAADLARLYDANLAYADDVIGRLRDRLAAAGLWGETALIVTADHGEALGEHGFVGHNDQVYDESTHVPLIVRGPGRERPGALGPKRIAALASLLDVAPTVAGLFGLPREACVRAGFRGRSLVAPDFGEGDERALLVRSAGDLPAFALRDHRMTLIVPSKGRAQLFDRQADSGETRDLAAVEVAALQQRLDTLAAHRKTLERKPEPDDAQPSARTQEALRALGYVR